MNRAWWQRCPAWLGFGLLLCLVSCAVWGHTVAFSFVWDDGPFIVANESLRSLRNVPRFFYDAGTVAAPEWSARFPAIRPLRNVSYALDYALVGLRPAWWHVHNVLLHTANAFLVAAVASRLLAGVPLRYARAGAGVAGTVFLLHPVQTEAVAWVKCRDDLISCFFALLALWLALRPTGGRRSGTAAGLAYLLACLGKEQAMALPPALGVARAGGAGGWAVVRRTLPFAALALVFLLWRHVVIGRTSQTGYLAGSLLATVWRMGDVLLHYVRLLLAPGGLVADYVHLLGASPPVWQTGAAWGAMALLGALLGWWAWHDRGARISGWWLLGAMLPVSNLVPMMQYAAERFLYLPMAAYAWYLGLLMAVPGRVSLAGRVLLGLVYAAALAVGTVDRLPVWRNEIALFSATVRDTPPGALRPRKNLIDALDRNGRLDEALALATEVNARLAREPGTVTVRIRAEFRRMQGLLELKQGSDRGLETLHQARVLDPAYAEPWADEGVWHARHGELQEAIACFDAALTRDPAHAPARTNRDRALRDLASRGVR